MTNSDPLSLLQFLEMQEDSLIEVFVTSVSYKHWVATIEGLAADGFILRMKHFESDVPVVLDPAMFNEGDNVDYLLSVEVGRQSWTTQFYSSTLIDFQGDPLGIRTEKDVADVVKFMRVISKATGRRVSLSSETLDYANATAYMTVGAHGGA
ncbi:hypothetical protein [Streptomyces sp. W4I9-2]|uniref:hypothetical protein n=1 Tax=Streptomyces sp. W4I9-2 TaxID=3042297 RepID=UPI002782375D|nr:hypothetical protein [Streptomyces sp. W4I9-2]MDQ0696292.1 hypothetical protein [Streptomyces sp. W4I9-2]